MNNGKPFHAGLMWFRRDLRAHDNAALHHALRSCAQLHCLFVFDQDILAPLNRMDRRVEFIQACLVELDATLRALAGHADAGLIVLHASARQAVPRMARSLGVQAVFANQDYEPEANARDAAVRGALADAGIALHMHKDQVVFAGNELLTDQDRPYMMFAPYKKKWLERVNEHLLQPYPVAHHAKALAPRPVPLRRPVPTLSDIGFQAAGLDARQLAPGSAGGQRLLADFHDRMDRYHAVRDFPALRGPSYLGVHLRFGTLSIRQPVTLARHGLLAGSPGAAAWLNELVWREFYFQVLAHFPHVATRSFKPEFDAIAWERGHHAKALFEAWQQGRTGYPLVDAGMRQLVQTGYMHNRLRMVAASFLVKDLGVDWRWGEHYFAQKLNDFDLSANNGGWQWCSSSGCDAQPWFRIFNPVTQSRRFDGQGKFIRRYIPELGKLSDDALHAPWLARPLDLASAGVTLGKTYPFPLVQHEDARRRTLQRYAVIKKPGP